MNRDKIVGMFLGIGIGDALGMPVESWPGKKIEETYGWVDTYLEPKDHKYFKGGKPGTWTDDTQLSLAVAEGMIESPFNMKIQARKHIEAFKETTNGWGGTTRNAIRDLANGCSWQKSGQSGAGRGKGNGVAMKLAPIAPFIRQIVESVKDEKERQKQLLQAFTFVRNLTTMTHNTEMAVAASFGHVVVLLYCLMETDHIDGLAGKILAGAKQGIKYARVHGLPVDDQDNILDRFALLEDAWDDNGDIEGTATKFGNLSCYCYDSVPGSHAFFLQSPSDISALYKVVNSGGDTDSTGSMVGALLGAYNGISVFPTYLIDGLDQKDKIIEVAEKICDKLGIK